jgi:hypothetical protein
METQTYPITTTEVAEKKTSTTYTFREITEADELEQAFRLRYEVYSHCRCSSLLKSNKNKMDLDVYDLHARHFGLFINENELAGYWRIVLNKNDLYNSVIFAIGRKYDLFPGYGTSCDEVEEKELADFPFLSYADIPKDIKQFYTSLKSRNEEVAEGSRLILKEQFRSVRTVLFLMDCMMMLFYTHCLGKRHAITVCVKEHAPFYQRYGFQFIGDDRGYSLSGSIKEAVCLAIPISDKLSSSTVPENLHPKIEAMAAEYKITGKITKTI